MTIWLAEKELIMSEKNIKVIESQELSTRYEKRYVVVDKETSEILDDAQGYGYKSVKGAYSAYAYKNRDKSKDKEKQAKQTHIQQWMKKHKGFVEQMNGFAFEIECKHSWGPEDKFDATFVKKMFKDHNLEPDFTAGELLKVWRKEN